MKLYHGTLIGPYHLADATPNQDYYDYLLEDELIVLAMADGAGSKLYSGEGAKLAVESCLDWFRTHDVEESDLEPQVAQAIVNARNLVLAQEEHAQMGSTLVIFVQYRNVWCVGVVGDSFAIIEEEDKFILISQPGDSEYVNVTPLLTSNSFAPNIVMGAVQSLKTSILSTDGLAQLGIKGKSPYLAFWKPLVERCRTNNLDVDQFFQYLDSKEKIVDDTTLMILIPEDGQQQ
jgi:hypothetical protein